MKKQSTGRGFAYLSIAELLVKVMSVIYVPLLVIILGDVGHGIYAISYEAFTLIYVLTNEGIQRGIAKLISELHATGNPRDALRAFRLSRTLMISGGLFASLLLYFMAPLIASASATPQAALSIQALAPTVLITAVLSAYRGYFMGRSFVSKNAISKIIEQLVNVVISLSAAYFLMKIGVEYGVAGGTLGTSLGALVAVGLLVWEFRKGKLYRIRKSDQDTEAYYHSNRELIRKLLSYAFPITLSAGMIHMGNFIDMFIVNNRLLDAGLTFTLAKTAFSQLARFKNLVVVPNTFIVSLASVLLPGIAAANAVGNKEEVKRKVNFSTKILFTVTLPSFIGLVILAEPIYAILYPGRGGAELLKYGAITVIFIGFIQVQNVIFQGLGKFYWGAGTMLLGIIVKLILNYVLVGMPTVNIYGAVVSYFINYFIPVILNHILITRVLKYDMKIFKNALSPAMSAIAMGLVIFVLNRVFFMAGGNYVVETLLTLINIIIGVLIYTVTLLLTGGVTKSDLKDMSPRVYKMVPAVIRHKMK